MTKMDIVKKVMVEISRLILGVTFVFSGFVKAVDPLGTAYKIQDYITAFHFFDISWAYTLALPISVFLCVLEFSLGALMLIGLYRRWTSRLVLLVMIFMTPLSLILALFNPVSDCGCFGDAFIISNWETFYKNIVLLICAVIAFLYCERIKNFYTGKFYWMIGLFVIVYGTIFTLYNYYYEPIFDFRSYKIGANLPKLMTVEEGKGPVYENLFIYEKDGVRQEFTMDNLPWQDSSWVFVDRIDKLVKAGDKPLITDFEINRLYFNPTKTDFEGENNITGEVLGDSNYVFLMISYSLAEMNELHLSQFEDVKNYAKDYGYSFYCLTSSTRDAIVKWEAENTINFDYCQTDERTLKTMIRSNPGLLLLKNGVIINKWPGVRVEGEETLKKPLDEIALGHMPDIDSRNKKYILIILLSFISPLLLLNVFDFLFYRRKNNIDQTK